MVRCRYLSKTDAKSILILGHLQSNTGEKIHSQKFVDLLQNPVGYAVTVIDVTDLFQDLYEPVAKLNYSLASSGFPIIEKMELEELSKIFKKLKNASTENIILLGWSWSNAALFATGIQKIRRTVVKLQVHHKDERVVTPLYEPAHLLLTESLLANQKGIEYGIDPSKMLYFPHCYPKECDTIIEDKGYIAALATNQGKKISSSTCIVGAISRLEYGKNCEFAIEAVRQLAEEGHDIALYLKGNLSSETPYPNYRNNLKEMLKTYEKEPWLIWDETFTPFPKGLSLYKACDLFLQLSGAEAGSHTIVELLGLGKAVICQKVSTQPFLFQGGVCFVQSMKERKDALVPFFMPHLHDLKEKLTEFVKNKKLRDEQGQRAKKIAADRFQQSQAIKRLPFIFNSCPKEIEEIYKRDLEAYGF